MAWIYLLVAAVFELLFVVSMKYAEGLTKLWPSVLVIVGLIGGLVFLTLAVKDLPVSIAYPIWTGIGTIGAVIFGMLLFNEPLTLVKAMAIGAIMSGIIVLKVISA